MNKSKLLLAALVAIPVSLGMVGEAKAEQTETLGDSLATPVDINKAIEGLNTRSTKSELEKVKEAYNNLSQELRQQISNYGKVEVLLEDLTKKEAEIANQNAAEEVIEMIQKIGRASCRE